MWISVHQLFESLAYLTAGQLIWYQRRRSGDFLSAQQRWILLAAAFSGAASGAFFVGAFDDPPGKTVVGGLVGGTLGIELIKWALRITRRTGDLYAIPIAVGIAIGRIGCFLTGLPDNTHGNPTSLPWGYDFGDGIPRHATQLYEVAFCLLLTLLLRRPRPWMIEGDRYRLLFFSYLSFRFVIDFLKPGSSPAIQIACLFGILMVSPDVMRWLKTTRSL